MVNKVQLIGRLGQKPEVRVPNGGTPVANFSVATSESWTDKNGQKQEKTEWHRIVAWGKLAEICGKYLDKGSQVFIEGKITYRSYDDKDGVKRYATDIVAHEMKMLGARPQTQGGEQPAAQQSQVANPAGFTEDEIPF